MMQQLCMLQLSALKTKMMSYACPWLAGLCGGNDIQPAVSCLNLQRRLGLTWQSCLLQLNAPKTKMMNELRVSLAGLLKGTKARETTFRQGKVIIRCLPPSPLRMHVCAGSSSACQCFQVMGLCHAEVEVSMRCEHLSETSLEIFRLNFFQIWGFVFRLGL